MKHGTSEETGNILQQLGWVRLAPLAKDVRPIQDFAQIVTLEEIQTRLSSKKGARAGAVDMSDLSEDKDATARPKSTGRRRAKLPTPTANPSKPLLVTATDTAKVAMTAQEPQLLDKMENVAYRLNTQADERKKHMNSRGVFGEAQNALRARSAQRVQLWKGLHPSALSEAVSHFTKSQKLQGKSSITRSATLQTRAEKACLDVLSRLDADLPVSAIHGTLDAHASGKLTGAKLDNAMAGTAADYAAARAKRRTLSPEQESAFSLRTAAAQAERLQQYLDRIAQESGAAAAAAASQRAHSNLEQIVDQFSQDDEAQQDTSARAEERHQLTACGPALLEAVLARIKAAEERLSSTKYFLTFPHIFLQLNHPSRPAATAPVRLQRTGTKAVGLKAANLLRSISFFPDDTAAGLDAVQQEQGPPAPTPKALTRAQTAVDYEFGKAFSQHDADRYFGGMRGLRTRSGHATFQAAAAKSWESGQRPRKLQPHEMPWARAARRAPSLAPQKSLAKPSAGASALGSLRSGSDFDAALRAEEEEEANKEAENATDEAQHKDVGTSASILDQPWEAAIALPSRQEIADIPMPELPNLEPPSPRTQFETIAQYLQGVEEEQVGPVQVRLERVWGILQMPVTAKLDWVIRYTGPEAADMFEPALQAFEQAAAAVLERERLLGQLSLIQQQLVQHEYSHTVSGAAADQSLSTQVERLGICFVIATVQVETAAQLLKDLFEESLTYQGATYPGEQALTLSQLKQFIARVHASEA